MHLAWLVSYLLRVNRAESEPADIRYRAYEIMAQIREQYRGEG